MDRVFELFPRLFERRTQKAGTMSGGEQQMCAIGRALMARPKLLLLDEPSMGLAPIFVEKIFEIVIEINKQGTPVLLVEQNALMALDVASRGYVLETGRVALEGPAAELQGQRAGSARPISARASALLPGADRGRGSALRRRSAERRAAPAARRADDCRRRRRGPSRGRPGCCGSGRGRARAQLLHPDSRRRARGRRARARERTTPSRRTGAVGEARDPGGMRRARADRRRPSVALPSAASSSAPSRSTWNRLR